tara:strand:+ start:681 stop:2117 length:1437 start_codon:yes stop_codon:yes gene_type:complete
MLDNIRKFSKTFLAKILLVIIIIPFVFWGMGGVFSGGNTNNIAKINNKNISTQDFFEYLNSTNISEDQIKKNINNNIIEENLAALISSKMVEMEIENLGLSISDNSLSKLIKDNINFKDENNIFSRLKYEKFLLTSNMSAPQFEFKLKERELRKKLFYYISGGMNPPTFFVNNAFNEETKNLSIEYFNLNSFYKKNEDITEKELNEFIKNNKDELEEKYITFKYSKITPKSLVGIEEFNNLFFEKIDEIENQIANGSNFESLKNQFQLKVQKEKDYKLVKNQEKNEFFKNIYENPETNTVNLLDKNEFYVLYEITNIEKKLPNKKDKNYIAMIKENLIIKSKFDFNTNLINKIIQNKFSQSNFDEFLKKSSAKIQKVTIKSVNDKSIFSNESIKYLYTLSKNKFAIIADDKSNAYLSKIIDVTESNIGKSSDEYSIYQNKAYDKMIENIYSSYDFHLNKKYKVKVNEKTLERVKNYFQ